MYFVRLTGNTITAKIWTQSNAQCDKSMVDLQCYRCSFTINRFKMNRCVKRLINHVGSLRFRNHFVFQFRELNRQFYSKHQKFRRLMNSAITYCHRIFQTYRYRFDLNHCVRMFGKKKCFHELLQTVRE